MIEALFTAVVWSAAVSFIVFMFVRVSYPTRPRLRYGAVIGGALMLPLHVAAWVFWTFALSRPEGHPWSVAAGWSMAVFLVVNYGIQLGLPVVGAGSGVLIAHLRGSTAA